MHTVWTGSHRRIVPESIVRLSATNGDHHEEPSDRRRDRRNSLCPRHTADVASYVPRVLTHRCTRKEVKHAKTAARWRYSDGTGGHVRAGQCPRADGYGRPGLGPGLCRTMR